MLRILGTCVIGVLLLVGICWCASAGCSPKSGTAGGAAAAQHSQPATTLEWKSHGGGFREWGCGGDYMYGTSVEPQVMDVWNWEGSTLVRYKETMLPWNLYPNWIDGDRIVFKSWSQSEGGRVVIIDAASGRVIQSWEDPQGWRAATIQISRNGEFIGMVRDEEVGKDSPPGQDFDHPRVPVGLIGPEREQLDWITTLIGRDRSENGLVRAVVPSDDGAYVAVAGYSWKVAMVDVAAKKALWVSVPQGQASLDYVAFSPDSKVLYAGGASGAVHAMDVRTGDVLSQWYASPTGQALYGHRISCLAASPDGRWVAAGTGPRGVAYIGSTADSKLVATLNHCGSTLLLVQFSPDSTALATFGSGTIKIWNVTSWDTKVGK